MFAMSPYYFCSNFKNHFYAPVGVARLVGRRPAEWKVAGWIPGQGSQLGYRFASPPVRVSARGNRSMFLSHIDVSLPLSPSLSE